MQVTSENFEAILPKFCELLRSCEFYSVDFEMTGIRLASEQQHVQDADKVSLMQPVDGPSFEDKNGAARRYSVIQVGISLFHRKQSATAGTPTAAQQPPSRPCYVATPFNFMVFPSDGRDVTIDSSTGEGVSFAARN